MFVCFWIQWTCLVPVHYWKKKLLVKSVIEFFDFYISLSCLSILIVFEVNFLSRSHYYKQHWSILGIVDKSNRIQIIDHRFFYFDELFLSFQTIFALAIKRLRHFIQSRQWTKWTWHFDFNINNDTFITVLAINLSISVSVCVAYVGCSFLISVMNITSC